MPANVSHIITALKALTGELEVMLNGTDPELANKEKQLANDRTLSAAEMIVACRKRRAEFHPSFFFGEPCWDILLDLFIARVKRIEVSVSNLCGGSQVPYATALRYLNKLESRGDITRANDPRDQRRVIVRISDLAAGRVVATLSDMMEFSGKTRAQEVFRLSHSAP
jgi:hypothetical protein